MSSIERYVLSFHDIDHASLPYVGGKGANLGELTKAGFPVPAGFCVTTSAYRRFIHESSEMDGYFRQLEQLDAGQLEPIREIGQKIREHLHTLPIPDEIRNALIEAWQEAGNDAAYAVRSSATAEDLPTASFAGQQETYLNVKGEQQLLQAVKQCWSSLFTDRAIIYRIKNGFDHRNVLLSVVVQQMVFPDVSGILFTADPITGHRRTVSIDASFGLGEALVSGIVSADLYQVCSGKIVRKKIADKQKAIFPLPEGGTKTCDLPHEQRNEQALADRDILALAELGKKIEAHYGSPQDIEWCLADGRFFILQSRPITSLFPVPQVEEDGKLHVFFSFGHQQMMTEAMRPLAVSTMRTVFPFGKRDPHTGESTAALEAGGRIYIDLTPVLYSKVARKIIPKLMVNMDERMSYALSEVIQRERFLQEAVPNKEVGRTVRRIIPPLLAKVIRIIFFSDPSKAVDKCNEMMERLVEESKQELASLTGAERIKKIRENLGTLLLRMISHFAPYLFTGIVTLKWIEHFSVRWLGDAREVPLLNRSLPGNVTSEMGLALGDLADAARPYPEVIAALKKATDATLYDELGKAEGGEDFCAAFAHFLDKYGTRCPGEIDITRPRWHEAPTTLVPAILSHLQTVEPGEHRTRFKQGIIEAEQAEETLLRRLREKKGGWLKAKWMSFLIRRYRNVMGIREHHKFTMIRHFALFKRAIMEEARQLAENGVLEQETDVFYLTLHELTLLLEQGDSGEVQTRISQRKKEYEWQRKLTPPRLMTSEGEVITGIRNDIEVPEDSLVGTPVSSGVAEGYARVVLKPESAELKPGEILIAPFTDPGWTPLFHSAKALVMEVGGLMTHGAVVAREYGIPAVVGVEGATEKIKDGQYIRVDGTSGYVQILEDHPQSLTD
ncbi:phosphoenolpyruvate synthase [Thermoactinomyces sp. CICC 10521]|uniref:phosphoenolpyruvate synthase n=1 Tax=Thermoactinomyces sp. CICC 10521 TaxID=2767426 RepID=UPI00351C0B88